MAKASRLMLQLGDGLTLMVGFPTIAYWDTSGRPQDAKPGTFGFNTDTNSLEYWDGAFWYAVALEEI